MAPRFAHIAIISLFVALAALPVTTAATAQERSDADSIAAVRQEVAVMSDSLAYVPLFPYTPKPKTGKERESRRWPGFIQSVVDYFSDSNKEHPDRRFDFTLIGGPSYSKATSVQLALVGAGLYRSRNDGGITPVSDITLKLQGSVTGFYKTGISGNHFGPENRYRVAYDANFIHFPLDFWGIGFHSAFNSANKSKYTRLQADAMAEFQWRLPGRVFIGPGVYFRYGKATKCERPELWNGEPLRVFTYGLGFTVNFDTRDNLNAPTRGWSLRLNQRFYPCFLGNDRYFSTTEITAGHYRTLWRGGVLAMQAHATLGAGRIPWIALPTLDESGAVRSYYEGRYASRNEADLVVELRQKIWRRNGIAVWAGAGSVFNQLRELNIHTLLPTVGIGYRWEFKKNTNVRIDLGIGRHSKEISMGLHETF